MPEHDFLYAFSIGGVVGWFCGVVTSMFLLAWWMARPRRAGKVEGI